MAAYTIDLEDCPKCGSEDLQVFDSHYCQAYIIICRNCRHEDGRERDLHYAATVWNRAAQEGQK